MLSCILLPPFKKKKKKNEEEITRKFKKAVIWDRLCMSLMRGSGSWCWEEFGLEKGIRRASWSLEAFHPSPPWRCHSGSKWKVNTLSVTVAVSLGRGYIDSEWIYGVSVDLMFYTCLFVCFSEFCISYFMLLCISCVCLCVPVNIVDCCECCHRIGTN